MIPYAFLMQNQISGFVHQTHRQMPRDPSAKARAAAHTAILSLCRLSLAHATNRGKPVKETIDAGTLATWDSTTASDDIFWLELRRSDEARALGPLLDALAILAAVATVDLSLWKTVVTSFWKENLREWADFIATRTALRVGVAVIVDEDDDFASVCDEVVAWLDAPPSVRYRTARALLQDLAPNKQLLVVPLQLNLRDYAFQDIEFMEQQLSSVCKSLVRQPADADARIVEIKSMKSDVPVAARTIATLVSIRDLGIRVTDLPLTNVDESEVDRRACLQYVRPLVDGTPQPTVLSTVPGVEKITVSSSLSASLVPSVFSAIHASRSVREVEVVLDAAPSADTLWWMTYALFCRDHSFAAMTISECDKLELSDIELMAQVLAAEDPLMLLFPGRNSHAVITTEALLDYPSEKTDSAKWAESVPSTLEIIGASCDDYLPVLVPGWGRAWVREHETVTSLPARRTTPTQLTLESTVTVGMPAVLALLRLVGHDLKHITINDLGEGHAPLDDFCREVLTLCPHVEELEVNGVQLTSFQFLLSAIDANECRALKRLTFQSINLGGVESIDAFLQLLADPKEAIATQLRKLHLCMSVCPAIPRETMQRAVAMLKHNSHLREVLFEIPQSLHLESFKSPLAKCHGKPVLSDPFPLPRRSILAFLSVFASGKRSKVFERFDCLLLSHILGFATVRRIRSVEAYFPFRSVHSGQELGGHHVGRQWPVRRLSWR